MFIHIYSYIHTYIHACMHEHAHIYLHSYINAYVHTYIHTYIELNDLYRAEFVLASAMKCQVTTIEALDDLDGYETDEISQPIDYMTYVILSVLRSKQGAPIQARRALRLAVISYENEMMMKGTNIYIYIYIYINE